MKDLINNYSIALAYVALVAMGGMMICVVVVVSYELWGSWWGPMLLLALLVINGLRLIATRHERLP